MFQGRRQLACDEEMSAQMPASVRRQCQQQQQQEWAPCVNDVFGIWERTKERKTHAQCYPYEKQHLCKHGLKNNRSARIQEKITTAFSENAEKSDNESQMIRADSITRIHVYTHTHT